MEKRFGDLAFANLGMATKNVVVFLRLKRRSMGQRGRVDGFMFLGTETNCTLFHNFFSVGPG